LQEDQAPDRVSRLPAEKSVGVDGEEEHVLDDLVDSLAPEPRSVRFGDGGFSEDPGSAFWTALGSSNKARNGLSILVYNRISNYGIGI